jgi:hypothetical protein
MPSDRWLKKAEPARNVSQSDVRRMEQEKRARIAAVSDPPVEEVDRPRSPPTAQSDPTQVTLLTPLTPPTAPSRDYAKVANSIVREAVASGMFAGKSKQLYDYLYSKTRGAIFPKRSVRLTKSAIMQGSHIGSERTMYKNLRRLETVGLVQVRSIAGEQSGSEYTILLPEEVAPLTPPTPLTDTTHTDHKVVTPLTAQSGVSGVSLNGVDSTTSSDHKTSSKTIDQSDDDEAFADFISRFKQAAKELTGKEPSAKEREKYGELAELLIQEQKIAAARTSVVSVPAFLFEHLRRRLTKKTVQEPLKRKEEAPSLPRAEIAPFKPEVIAAHLADARKRLERTGEQLKGDAAPALCDVLSQTAARLSEIATEVGATDNPDVQGLEDSLTKLDEALDDAVGATIPPAELAARRAEAVAKLASYSKRMETDAYEEALNGLTVKLQREKYGLPRLSMFYL